MAMQARRPNRERNPISIFGRPCRWQQGCFSVASHSRINPRWNPSDFALNPGALPKKPSVFLARTTLSSCFELPFAFTVHGPRAVSNLVVLDPGIKLLVQQLKVGSEQVFLGSPPVLNPIIFASAQTSPNLLGSSFRHSTCCSTQPILRTASNLIDLLHLLRRP
jgi:hypothetical protein